MVTSRKSGLHVARSLKEISRSLPKLRDQLGYKPLSTVLGTRGPESEDYTNAAALSGLDYVFVKNLSAKDRSRAYAMEAHRWESDTTARFAILFSFRGTGKSAACTTYGYVLHDAWVKAGIRDQKFIASNYKVEFADRSSQKIIQEAAKYGDIYQNGALLIDEFAEIAPSKRANNAIVVSLEAFFKALRKRRLDVIGTAQFLGEITSSFQRQADYFIKPKIYKKYDYFFEDGRGYKRLEAAELEVLVWNWSGSVTGQRLVDKMTFPPEDYTAQDVRRFANIKPILDMYETEEIIVSIIHKDRDELIKKLAETESIADQIFGSEARLDMEVFYNKCIEIFNKGKAHTKPDPNKGQVFDQTAANKFLLEIIKKYQFQWARDEKNNNLVLRTPLNPQNQTGESKTVESSTSG